MLVLSATAAVCSPTAVVAATRRDLTRESEEVQTLLDRVDESNITTSGDTQQAYSPVNTTHMTLGNSGLGARAGDETAVAMECEIMSEREDGEQSMMAGGGTGQHTTGASKEMTQEDRTLHLRMRTHQFRQ